ncbi:hypothetical protein E3P94_01522 [Wallemia ichthyophaga]|nr:hypothetical protein E3P95_01390 [Wallemia ichthyophaga]TIB02168.1 hypothetical protein E3P94_01522 [Wallemia ichthyophaga]
MLQDLVKIAHNAPTLPIRNYYAALFLPLQARLLVAPPSSLNTTLRAVLLCTTICVAFLGESTDNQDDFIAGYNYNLFMGVCCMHSVHLTFTTRSRIDAHKVDSSSKRYHSDLGWSGAFEMLTNFRGIGMNWGVPSEKLPAVYKHFVTDTLFEMLKHHVMYVTSTAAITRLSQYNPDEVMGRDVAITVAVYALGWSGLNLMYSIVSLCVYTLTKLLGLPFDKSRWPPLFNNVITSDSVRTFWNNKWQCLFRRHFMMCGYKPAFNLINALSVPGDIPHYCGLMGAFTVSGLIHELCLRSTSRTIFMDGTFPTFAFFIIQALAIILENEFYKYTGRRVSGIFGRLWFAFIIIFTAIPMARHNLFGLGQMSDFAEWDTWRWFVPLSV